MLDKFVVANREEIISRCRTKVTTRLAPTSNKAEVDHGVPVFLEQLVDALRLGRSTTPDITKSATRHGHDLLLQGFTVSQVVHDYGDVCQVITEMAVERKTPINTDDFRMLNQCLDDAIAGAVTEFGREPKQPSRGGAADENNHVGGLARELRTSIHTAIVALEMIQSGRVGVAGSTGTLLGQSLFGAQDLIERVLVEVSAPHHKTDPVM
jgi:hypothetical protein